MNIERIDDGKKGYFKLTENGTEKARMTFTWAGPDKFIIDHTEVYPSYEGKGLGKKLVMEAVQFAREKKIKILPLCTYAKSVFDRTPEIGDVLF